MKDMELDKAFDCVFLAEERYHEEGYSEGISDGRSKGLMEGMKLGIEQGAKVGSELGFYYGFAKGIDLTKRNNSRLVKAVNTLCNLIDEFLQKSPQDESIQELLQKIRAKFKQIQDDGFLRL